jgi:hypothetical protein
MSPRGCKPILLQLLDCLGYTRITQANPCMDWPRSTHATGDSLPASAPTRQQRTPRSLARAHDMSGPRESSSTTPNPAMPAAICASRSFRDGRPSQYYRHRTMGTGLWADRGSTFYTSHRPFEPPFQRFCSSKNCLVSKAPAGVAIPTRIDRASIANTVVFIALSPSMKRVRGKMTLLWSFA